MDVGQEVIGLCEVVSEGGKQRVLRSALQRTGKSTRCSVGWKLEMGGSWLVRVTMGS